MVDGVSGAVDLRRKLSFTRKRNRLVCHERAARVTTIQYSMLPRSYMRNATIRMVVVTCESFFRRIGGILRPSCDVRALAEGVVSLLDQALDGATNTPEQNYRKCSNESAVVFLLTIFASAFL